MLVIEIDGRSHDNAQAVQYDKKRQQEIEKLGIYFLRFDDLEVKKDIGNVLRTIEYYIEDYRANN